MSFDPKKTRSLFDAKNMSEGAENRFQLVFFHEGQLCNFVGNSQAICLKDMVKFR